MLTNENIEDRIDLINQLQKAEAWLEKWNETPGLSDSDIEDRIRLVNELREVEEEVEA